jgi:hypothetical protein
MTKYTAERLKLFEQFLESVLVHFKFLEQFGCEFYKIAYGHILYSSRSVDINLYYERISFELYLIVALKTLNLSCSIDEIIQLRWHSKSSRQYKYATSIEMIDKAVAEIALLLERYGKDFITGNIASFKEIDQRKQKQHDIFIQETMLDEIEKKAISAWKDKDYNAVIEIYNSILKHLTPIQRKKLDICLRKMNQL